jgi:hypothetical protein
MQHRIESSNTADLVNENVTLSVNISNSLLTTVTWKIFYANSVDNFSAVTQINTGTFTVSSTATNYNVTLNLGANAANGILVQFLVGAQTSGTWKITGVQLEAGSLATPFERLPIGETLMLCQRYLPAFVVQGTGAQGPIGQSYSTTDSLVSIPFPVTARTPATGITVTNATNFQLTQISSARVSATAITFSASSLYFGVCTVTVAAGTIAGSATLLWASATPCQILFTGCEL